MNLTSAANPSGSIDLANVHAGVNALLDEFLELQQQRATTRELLIFIDRVRRHVSNGGKRIRSAMCVAGWYAVTDEEPPEIVYRVAASLELFHSFALIHDDVMDRSETRRGQPTEHRYFTEMFADRPDSDILGIDIAILLGDLTLGWSYEILWQAECGFLLNCSEFFSTMSSMRTETMVGQYLDLQSTRQPDTDIATLWRVIEYKTAKYTIERPLHLGALLADARPSQLRALSSYARPVGEAFQLRDDLLGVIGDPAVTGKSDLDDIRDGKTTLLTTLAMQRATPEQAATLTTALAGSGISDDHARAARAILIETGATDVVERMIDRRRRRAHQVLDRASLRPAATTLLRSLADTVALRSK
ncbi:polyprenyl synthetase family protein [Nocardia brasiliensis]